MKKHFPQFVIFIFLLNGSSVLAQVAYYKFNGNANNSTTVAGINGIINGATLSGDRCNTNNSYSFTGSNTSNIVVNDNNVLDLSTAFTFAAWVYIGSATGTSQYFISKSQPSVSGYNFGISNNKLLIEFYNGTTTSRLNSGVLTALGWIHTAATWQNGGDIKMFINGILVGSLTGINTTIAGNNLNLILGSHSISGNAFNGKLSELQIYDVESSETAILNLYNNYAGLTSVSTPLALDICEAAFLSIAGINTLGGSNLIINWYKGSSPITNATDGGNFGNTYTTSGLGVMYAYPSLSGISFFAVVSGSCGTVTTSGTTLTVNPNVNSNIPAGLIVCQNSSTIIPSTISGTNVSFAWLKSGIPINAGTDGGIYSGYNSTILTVTGIPLSLTGVLFNLSVAGNCGSPYISSGLTLTVNPAPAIISDPSDILACKRTTVVWSASITGVSSYRWLYKSSPVGTYAALSPNTITRFPSPSDFNSMTGTNLTNMTMYVSNSGGALIDGYIFALSATGVCGSITTLGATLSVNPDPIVVAEPLPLISSCPGISILLPVTIIGANLKYQWYRNGSKITSSNGIYGSSFTTTGLNISPLPSSISGSFFECEAVSVCNTSTTTATTTGSTLTVYNLLGITNQPPPTIATCVGLNAGISMTATGSGVNFQWQQNSGAGWSDIISPGTSPVFSGYNTNSIGLTGIPLSASGYLYRNIVSSAYGCGIPITSTGTLLTVTGGPQVDLLNLRSKYCSYDNGDTLIALTTLSFAGGNFILTPATAGVLTPLSSDRAIFNPTFAGSTMYSIQYTTPSDAKGCFNSITKNTNVYTIAGFSLSITQPTQTQFPSDGDPIPLVATSSVSGTGVFSLQRPDLTGAPGISGNTFYPSLYTPKPTGGLSNSFNLVYTFTDAISGCQDKVIEQMSVFDPVGFFSFTPYQVGRTNQATFCGSDNSLYNISFTGSAPAIYPGCVKPVAIDINGYTIAGVTGIAYNLNSFQITPSSVFAFFGGVLNYNLRYTTEQNFYANYTNWYYAYYYGQLYASNPIINIFYKFYYDNYGNTTLPYYGYYDQPVYQNNCDFNRTIPTPYRTQRIKIYPITPKPTATPKSISFCFGSVTGTSFNIIGTGIKWYVTSLSGLREITSLAGLNSISTNQLGIKNNTQAGEYYFYLRQFQNECASDTTTIKITIYGIPSIPIVSTLPGFCTIQDFYPTFIPASSTTGVAYEWYDNNNNLISNSISYINDPEIYGYVKKSAGNLTGYISNFTNNPKLFTYYVTSTKNGCESPRIQKDIIINARPASPVMSLSSITDYASYNGLGDYNSYYNKVACIKSPTENAPLLIASSSISGVKFRWYKYDASNNSVNYYYSQPNYSYYDYSKYFYSYVGPPLYYSYYYMQPVIDDLGTISGSNLISAFDPSFVVSVSAANFYKVNVYDPISGCESLDGYIRLFSNPIPTSPSYTKPDITCNDGFFPSLTVNGVGSIKWYADALGTVDITSAASGNSLSITGTLLNNYSRNKYLDTAFYATQTINGCEGPLIKTGFQVYGPFSQLKPVSNSTTLAGVLMKNELDKNFCTNRSIGEIKAINLSLISISGVNWYDSNLSLVGNNIYVQNSVSSAQQITLYPQQYKITPGNKTCYSSITLSAIVITVNSTPTVPIARDTAYCYPGTVGDVFVITTFAGIIPQFKWFRKIDPDNSIGTGNNSISAGQIKNTLSTPLLLDIPAITSITGNIPFTRNFLVNQTLDGCTSDAAEFSMSVFKKPDAPVSVSPPPYCSGQTIAGLNVENTGAIFLWYNTTTTGSSPIGIGKVYTPTIPNSVAGFNNNSPGDTSIFYVTQVKFNINSPTLNFSGCESNAKADTIIIFGTPPPPITDAVLFNYCSRHAVANLTASGFSNSILAWYNNSTSVGTSSYLSKGSGISLNSGLSGRQTSVSETYPYYVTQTLNNCEGTPLQITLNLRPLPLITFTGILPKYCQKDPVALLTGASITGTSLTNGLFKSHTLANGILLNTFAGMALFNPEIITDLQTKVYDVIYTYTDNYGCSDSVSKDVIIYPRPIVSINPLDTGYCAYTGFEVQLSGNPASGNFIQNNGVSGNKFFPINAASNGYGPKEINYVYTDVNNCTNNATTFVNVHPSPNASYTLSSACVGDKITLTSISTISGVDIITKLRWNIDNNFKDSVFAHVVYDKSGLSDITLKVESSHGCVDSTSKIETIGAYPKVAFEWKNICQGDVTDFINKSTIAIGNIISSWKWNFGDMNILSDTSGVRTPTYEFQTPGKYKVVLTAISQVTSDNDYYCITSDTNDVNTLPTIINFPYIENFESDKGGWFTEGRNSSWQHGQLNQWTDLSQAPQANGWYTYSVTGYNSNEQSFLNSPCFDVASLYKPMINLNLAYQTEKVDGTLLQYSIDGGANWLPTGSINEGINWFNSFDIVSDPGEQLRFQDSLSLQNIKLDYSQVGWVGTSSGLNGFINARNILDKTKFNNKNIRLRFAFASTEGTTGKGVALDNFIIEERSKVVLLENFVNTGDTASSTASIKIDTLLNRLKEDMVAIQYHTSFPDSDPFNTSNPADPSSRVLYYGIESVPRASIDGTVIKGRADNILAKDIYKGALKTPQFSISISNTNTIGDFAFDVVFKALQNIEPTQLVAYVAIIEREIGGIDGIKGKTKYENVLRKMHPSAAGIIYEDSWIKDEFRSVKGSWTYSTDKVTNPNQLGIVAFIQNKDTKEVLQAAYIGPKQANSATEVKGDLSGNIVVYPNPACDLVNISLNNSISIEMQWSLYDQLGKEVQNGLISPGTLKTEINTSLNSMGIYILIFKDREGILTRKKVVLVK